MRLNFHALTRQGKRHQDYMTAQSAKRVSPVNKLFHFNSVPLFCCVGRCITYHLKVRYQA